MSASTNLTRPQFAALMYRIFEVCYPNPIDRARMLGGNAKYLFGYDIGPKDVDMSISRIMEKSPQVRGTVNGRAIENFCKVYNEKNKTGGDIELSTRYYNAYLSFAQLSSNTLETLALELAARFGAAFPPAYIRDIANLTEAKSSAPVPQPAEFAENIHAFTRSNWFFYFYEYEALKPCLIRLVMRFEQMRNTYSVHLVNTSEKYATYTGEIKEMTARRLRIEFTGEEGKTMNFMAHMDPSGDSEIYMGKFMKNSAGVVSCSTVLHRIPDSILNPTAESFYYGEPAMDASVPNPIRNFFERKEYVYTKVIRSYSLDRLDAWLKKKQEERGEDIVRHIFLAAPVGAYHDQSEIVNKLKQEVGNVFLEQEQADSPTLKNLRKQIEERLHEKLIGSYAIVHKADNFREDVFDFQDAIQKKFSIEAYFAPRNDDYYYRSHKTNLQEEWKQLRRSRALLMIVPARPLFSSCWVILGWAMAWKMPIFLICHGEDGLPNMVRFADIHDNIEKINLSRLHHTLADAPGALDKNVKWLQLLRQDICS